jgi:hypothetical protein
MFNVDQFVTACQGQPPSVVKALLEEALRDPESIKHALAAIGKDRQVGEGNIGDLVIFQSPDLTVLKQENNTFYRRSSEGLETAGGRELQVADVLVLGAEAIHAIENPLERTSYAIHIYGGNLPSAQRSMWNPVTLKEEPLEYQSMMRYARQLAGKEVSDAGTT